MAVWECAECTTAYSVGAPRCPQCRSTVRVNEKTQPPKEDEMAKTTVHGGPSNAAADEAEGAEDAAVESSEAAVEEPEKAPRQRRTRSK